jgi:ABC-type lipopolysaccharide export system ATPase subunit
VYIIQKGKLLSMGHPSVVVREPKTRELFLGKDFEWQER